MADTTKDSLTLTLPKPGSRHDLQPPLDEHWYRLIERELAEFLERSLEIWRIDPHRWLRFIPDEAHFDKQQWNWYLEGFAATLYDHGWRRIKLVHFEDTWEILIGHPVAWQRLNEVDRHE